MSPLMIAAASTLRRWRRLTGIALQPLRHVVIEELLAPDHARQRLTLDEPLILGQRLLQTVVETVRLRSTPVDEAVEAGKRFVMRGGREPQADGRVPTGQNFEAIMRSRLGSLLRAIDRVRCSADD